MRFVLASCFVAIAIHASPAAEAADSNQQSFLKNVFERAAAGDSQTAIATLNKRYAYEVKQAGPASQEFLFDLIALKLDIASQNANEQLVDAAIADIKGLLDTAKGSARDLLLQKLAKSPVLSVDSARFSRQAAAFRRHTKIKVLETQIALCTSSTPACGQLITFGNMLNTELRALQENNKLVALSLAMVKNAEETKNKSAEFTYVQRLAYSYRKAGDLATAAKTVGRLQSLEAHADGGKTEGQATVASEKAFIASLKKDFTEANQVVDSALKGLKASEYSPEARFYLLLEKVKIQHYQGQVDAALKGMNEIFALHSQILADDKHSSFSVNQLSGFLHAQKGDARKSFEFLKKAMDSVPKEHLFFQVWNGFYLTLAAAAAGNSAEAATALKNTRATIQALETARGNASEFPKIADSVQALIGAKTSEAIKQTRENLIRLATASSPVDLPTIVAVEALSANIKPMIGP